MYGYQHAKARTCVNSRQVTVNIDDRVAAYGFEAQQFPSTVFRGIIDVEQTSPKHISFTATV